MPTDHSVHRMSEIAAPARVHRLGCDLGLLEGRAAQRAGSPPGPPAYGRGVAVATVTRPDLVRAVDGTTSLGGDMTLDRPAAVPPSALGAELGTGV